LYTNLFHLHNLHNLIVHHHQNEAEVLGLFVPKKKKNEAEELYQKKRKKE
jgi:hypothetical protein